MTNRKHSKKEKKRGKEII